MSSSPKKLENDSLVNDVHKTSIAVAKQEKSDKSKKNEASAGGTKHESAKRRGRTMAKAAIPGAKAVNSKTSTQPTSDTTDRDVKQCARVMVKATVPGAVASTSGSVSKQLTKGGAPKVSSHLAASLMMPPSEPSMTPEITNRKQVQKEIATSSTSDRDAKQFGRAKVKATVPGAVSSASGSVSKQVATGGSSKVSSHLLASLMEPPYEPSMKLETTARFQGQNELLMIQHLKSQVETLEEEKMRFLDTIAALNKKIMDADEASTFRNPSAVVETTPRKLNSDRDAKQCGRVMVKASVPGAVASASGSGSKEFAMGGAPKVSSHLAASLMEPPSEPSITLETTARYQGQKEVVTLASSDRDAKQCGRGMVKATVPGAVASAYGSVSKQVATGRAPKVSSHLVASLIEPPSEPSMTLETTARYQGQKEVVTLSSSDRDAKQCGRAMVKATVPGAVASASGSLSKDVATGGAPKISSHLTASLIEAPSEPYLEAETTARYQGQEEVATLSSSDQDAKQCGRAMVKATVPGAVASASGSGSKQVPMGGAPKISSHLTASLIEAPSEPYMEAETTARYQGQEEVATLSISDRGAKQRKRAMAKASDPASVVAHEEAKLAGAVSVEPSFLTEPSSEPFSQSSSSIEFCDNDAIVGDATMDPAFAANESVGPTVLEAIKVEDEYIPEAMAVSEEEINKKGRRRCMIFLCFLVMAIVVSVTIAVKISNQDDNSNQAPSEVPSLSPSMSAFPTEVPSVSLFPTTHASGRLEMLLPSHLIESLYMEQSAQSKALLWLEMNQTSNTPGWTDEVLLEKFAAATLYYSTNGDEWTNNKNWLSDNDICGERGTRWRGFLCDANNLIVQLSLDSNKLVGELPAEVSLFRNLNTLRLKDNVIRQTIPTELGLMSSLIVIDLSGNNLLGEIPTEIGNMTSIRVINLSDNSLRGHIPSTLSSISGLKRLELSVNSLTGSIPSEVGLLSDLTTLSLKENSIFGEIPSELGMNLELENLELEGNKLAGTIPITDNSITTNSTDLKFKQMIKLTLADNSLTGTIPTEIGLLDKLEILNVQGNGLLTGHIPSEIGVLVGLRELLISGNDLSGPIPSEIGLLHKLPILDVQELSLTGSLPTEIGLMESLESLLAKENSLTGSIPSEIGQLTELGVLSLAGSDFTGSLPSQLFLSKRLTEMDLSRNDLSGSLPTDIGVLTLLQNINLGVNNFSGSIPTEIGLARSLEVIEIAANKFSGSFPTEISLLVNLQNFFVNNNKFVGSLPTEIGLLIELEYLRFVRTDVTGTLPSEIGLLGRLKFLDMEYENLVGPLPTELGLLADLSKLNFAYNYNLGGPIPSELGLLTSLTELLLGYADLSGTIPTEICSLLDDKLTQCFDQNWNRCSC